MPSDSRMDPGDRAVLIGTIAALVALVLVVATLATSVRLDGANRRDHRLSVVTECVELEDPLVQLDCVNEALGTSR